MTPLLVRCHVPQAVSLRSGVLMLDALLMAMVARRDGLPPVETARAEGLPMTPPIPVAEAHGVYQVSEGRARFAERELRNKNRRPPIVELLHLAPRTGRADISTGPNKAYRVPYETGFLAEPLTWYCLGDAEGIRALLALCTAVGRMIGVGYGRVERWEVAPCETWPGFPVLRAGRPLRPLPLDYPGVTEGVQRWGVYRPPYWEYAREEAVWTAA